MTPLWDHPARRLACGGPVVRWGEGHTTPKSFAVPFGAQGCMVAQGVVGDTTPARGHGSKGVGSSGLAHFFGGNRGGHPQFFEPQGTLILAIEGNLPMLAGGKVQHFQSKKFEGTKEFSAAIE